MKYLLIIIVLLGCCHLAPAQLREQIQNFELATDEDYRAAEPFILESIAWLDSVPQGTDDTLRSQLNFAVIAWAMDAPDFDIVLSDATTPTSCFECYMAYMRGWIRYALAHDYGGEKLDAAMAANENAIAYYQKNKSAIGTDEQMENIIKIYEQGKLRDLIAPFFETEAPHQSEKHR